MSGVLVAAVLGLGGPAWAASWEPSEVAARDYDHGVVLAEAGELRDAEASFRAVLAREPECGLALRALGYVLHRQDRGSEAVLVLRRAAALHADRAAVQVALAAALFGEQEFDDAVLAGGRAVELDAASLDAHVVQQRALLRLGRAQEARAALEASRGVLPAPAAACLEVELLVEEGAVDSARTRIAHCRKAAQKDLVAAAEALVSYADGRDTALLRSAERLGMDTVALTIEAVDRLEAGDPTAAATMLDAVLERAPDRLDARVLRGQARYRLGDRAGARADLEAALRGGSWIEVHESGAMSGVLRASDEGKLRGVLADGGALLAYLVLAEGDVGRASALVEETRNRFVDRPSLVAVEALVTFRRGDRGKAWEGLADALRATPSEKPLLQVAGEMAFEDAGGVPLPVREALRKYGTALDRRNAAAGLLNRGDAAGCLSEIGLAPGSEPVLDADLRAAYALGFACAVAADKLGIAVGFLGPAGGASLVDTTAAVGYARLLYRAERWPEAYDVAGTVKTDDPRVASLATAVAIGSAIEMGRWDDALRWAGRPEADPHDQLYLAARLAERDAPLAGVAALLDRACPRLTGDDAAACAALRSGATP